MSKKMGRPSKFTELARNTIIEALRRGNYLDTAATLAGVSRVTLFNWLNRGNDEESGEYRDFLNAVKSASAEAESDAVEGIRAAGNSPAGSIAWQALAWFLERRFRDKWAKNSDLGTTKLAPPLVDTTKSEAEPEQATDGK